MYNSVILCIKYTLIEVGKKMSTTQIVNHKQTFEELLLNGATESARQIYSIISTNTDIQVKEILELVPYSARTVRQAIKILQNLGLIKQVPSLQDCRSHYYRIA